MNALEKITNQDILRKAFETGDFPSGVGLLNPEQQDMFVVLLKRHNVLLSLARSVRMTQGVSDIDKLHVSEPITRSAAENTMSPTPTKPKTNKVTLVTKKLISNWDITTETLQENIEKRNFESTLMNSLVQRIGVDVEMLAIQGDEAGTLVAGSPVSELLINNDGWYKKSLSSHVLDLGGASISRSVFREMLRMMPKQYRNDPELRFIMSDSTFIDWQDLLAGGNAFATDAGAVGADSIAAAAFSGSGNGINAPYGRRVIRAPLIPDDLPISVPLAASYAYADGIQLTPYKIFPGINDTLIVSIDGGAPVTITFAVPAGGAVLDLVEIVSVINSSLGATGLALDNGEQKLRIRSATDGVGSAITILSEAAGSTANETLGFPKAGVLIPALAGTSGTVSEGSFIWLCNPKNLIWGMLDQTRIFTEFNKDYDRIETVVYSQLDFEIENLDAMVVATGLRRTEFA